MFTLGTLTDGKFEINAQNTHAVTLPTDGTYVSLGASGTYPDTIKAFRVTGGQGSTRWKIMADGTLVQARNAGIRGNPSLFYLGITGGSGLIDDKKVYDNFSSAWANTRAVWKDSVSSSGNQLYLYSTYADATLGGGAYRVKTLRSGVSKAEYNQSEFKKYIGDMGVSGWSFDSVPCGGGRIWSTSGNYSSTAYWAYNSGVKKENIGAFGKQVTLRFMAVPTGSVPTLTPIETDLGIITEPTSVTIQMAGSPQVTATMDEDQSIAVSTAPGNFTEDHSAIWSDASYGDHEIICVAEQNGYKTGARIRFTKSASAVMVTTAPHSSTNRPTSCRLVGNIVVPTGAVLTQEVTNNGNDDSPVWETYEGTSHEFANDSKTASQWGLAARVSIDNNHGNAVAEIKDSLAMGVLYEGGTE